MFNLDDCIAYVTSKGAKMLAERLEKRFEPWNITRVQWIALYYIEGSEKITQKQLADRMGLKEPTVVRLLDRMEKEGLVLRERSLNDKRIKYLRLTQKGKELNWELMQVGEAFKNDAIRGMTEEELSLFQDVLNRMLENTKIE